MEVSENDLGTLFVYSNPNLDFEATGNNVDLYGYVGTLQNINVNGDLILIDSIAVYVREGNPSPNLDTPVWCRLLKFVDNNWEIIYQSTESKSIRDIAPETLFSFKMKAINEQNKLIKYNDKIAIVYVDAEDAPVISSIQLGFKAILGIGGGVQNQFVNESTGVSNWAPAFVIGYLSMADTPANFVTIENSQTITGTKQFNGGINIADKSFITSAIDGGELKVLHNNSSKGFIVRTVNDSDDVLPLEILSTDGYDSYKYTFPPKSGEVAIKEDVNSVVSPLQEDITNIKNKDAEQDAKINNVKGTLEQTFAEIASVLDEKQPLLTGDEFKTINGQSIMGDGNIEVKEGMTEAEKSEINAKIDNIVIPTKVSELENDEGYITEIPEGYATKDDVSEAVSGKQDALTLTVKDNGNIVIGNISGQSKEFMPATPSGDPMHWAYVSAGAEYNATDDFILKKTPWGSRCDTVENKAKWGLDVVDASRVKQMTIRGVVYNYATANRTSREGGTYLRYFLVGQGSNGVWVEDETKVLHLPKHWYYNGLGDITNGEMMRIRHTNLMLATVNRGLQNTWARTLFFSGRIEIQLGQISLNSDYLEAISGFDSSGFNLPSYINTFFADATRYCYQLKWNPQIGIYHTLVAENSQVRVLYINSITGHLKVLSKYLSKPSVKYMIEKATPATAITITLHPDAYARLAEDADIVAALEAKNTALEGTGGSVSLVSA